MQVILRYIHLLIIKVHVEQNSRWENITISFSTAYFYMTGSMLRKAKCENNHRAKVCIATVIQYTREYISLALRARFLWHWRQEFQERVTIGHRPRYKGPRIISGGGVAKIEGVFQIHSTSALNIASVHVVTLFTTLQSVLHKTLTTFLYKKNLFLQLLLEYCSRDTLVHTIIVIC